MQVRTMKTEQKLQIFIFVYRLVFMPCFLIVSLSTKSSFGWNRVDGRKTVQYAVELEREKEVMSDVVHSLVVGGFLVL